MKPTQKLFRETDWRYPLFLHLAAAHDLCPSSIEMDYIIMAVEQCQKRRAADDHRRYSRSVKRAKAIAPKAKAVRKMAGPKVLDGYEIFVPRPGAYCRVAGIIRWWEAGCWTKKKINSPYWESEIYARKLRK